MNQVQKQLENAFAVRCNEKHSPRGKSLGSWLFSGDFVHDRHGATLMV